MATRRSPSALPVVMLITAIIVVVAVGIFYLTMSSSTSARKAEAEKVAAEKYVATHPPTVKMEQYDPSKVSATTPATLTLDYGFSLEADGPIMVQYPGEKAFLFKPGGGANNSHNLSIRVPRSSGIRKIRRMGTSVSVFTEGAESAERLASLSLERNTARLLRKLTARII